MSNITKLDTPATQLADASKLALETLTLATARAKGEGLKSLRKAFGPDADNAAATLATRTARVMSGEAAMPRGGTATRIGNVRKLVVAVAEGEGDVPPAPITAQVFVSAARVVLDAHARAEADKRAALKSERAAAKDKLNDRGAPMRDRKLALETIAKLDGIKDEGKNARMTERVTATFDAARAAGWSATQLGDLLALSFPGITVTVADVPVQVAA